MTPSVFEGDNEFGNTFYSFEQGWVKVIVLSSQHSYWHNMNGLKMN